MEASRRGFRAGVLLVLFVIALCLPLVKNSSASQTTQVVLHPSDDAYVDSGNSNSNYGSSAILATEAYNLYGLWTRYMNGWLMFSLSSIPPSATITSAVLSVTGAYSDYYAIVGAYGSTSNSWSENTITWNNQPSQGPTPTDTQYVTNSTSLYYWSVTSLVANSLSNGAVSVVLKPTSSQSSNGNGYSVYYSKEAGGSLTPSLTITYSYVSSTVSVPSTVQYGNGVTVTGNTDPVQSGGTTVLQYSSDQVIWNSIASGSGGTYSYSWTPPSVGTFYVRSSWTVTWSGGSYTANSAPSQLSVSPPPTSLTLSAPTSSSLDQSIVVIATLKDSKGNPVSNAGIRFTIGSTVIGNAVTNPSGSASITYTLTQAAGSYAITATYGGSSTYLGSSAESALVIDPWTLTITSGVSSVPLVNFNGVNYTTDISNKVLIHVSSSGNYLLRVNSPLLTAEGTRAVFVSWGDGTTSSTRTVNIDSDTSLSISTKLQYRLTIVSTYGRPAGKGWYDSGSVANFSIQSAVDQGNSTQRVLTGWSKNGSPFLGASNGTLVMNGPTSLSAAWQKQFYLTLVSPYGSPSGGGWHDAGSQAAVSLQSPVKLTNVTRYVVSGFNGTGAAPLSGSGTSVSFALTSPSTLSFQWKTQYLVQVSTPYGSPSGEGWYDSGSQAEISVSPTQVATGLLTSKVFHGWTGNATGTSQSLSFTVDGPMSITATWVDNYTELYVVGGVVAIAAVAGGVYLLRRSAAAKK
ncbi:MAG: DNRLRE domain-containing protein [Nitrososphaerales archaeon]